MEHLHILQLCNFFIYLFYKGYTAENMAFDPHESLSEQNNIFSIL